MDDAALSDARRIAALLLLLLYRRCVVVAPIQLFDMMMMFILLLIYYIFFLVRYSPGARCTLTQFKLLLQETDSACQRRYNWRDENMKCKNSTPRDGQLIIHFSDSIVVFYLIILPLQFESVTRRIRRLKSNFYSYLQTTPDQYYIAPRKKYQLNWLVGSPQAI